MIRNLEMIAVDRQRSVRTDPNLPLGEGVARQRDG